MSDLVERLRKAAPLFGYPFRADVELAADRIEGLEAKVERVSGCQRWGYGIDYDAGGNKYLDFYEDSNGTWVKFNDVLKALGEQ